MDYNLKETNKMHCGLKKMDTMDYGLKKINDTVPKER